MNKFSRLGPSICEATASGRVSITGSVIPKRIILQRKRGKAFSAPRTLLALTLGFVFAIGIVDPASAAYTGRVHLTSPTVSAGEHFSIGAYLGGNNEPFAGVHVPLRFDKNVLTIDSISYVGSITVPTLTPIDTIILDSGRISVLVIPPFSGTIPTISVDSGLLFSLWATVKPSISNQLTNIDSVYFIDTLQTFPLVVRYDRIEFSDAFGLQTFTPAFTKSSIFVLSTDVSIDDGGVLPLQFGLSQNYPNPFNPATEINFSLGQASFTSLKVFNVLGQSVATLVAGQLSAGAHTVHFQADAFPSGVYFYRLEAAGHRATRTMILAK